MHKKKILISFMTDSVGSGINKYLIDFISKIKSDDIEIDCLTSYSGDNLIELSKSMGFKIYEVPKLSKPIKQYNKIKSIIKNNKYDIMYSNISESFNCISTICAKKNGVKKVVVHSHATGISKTNFFKRHMAKCLNSIFKRILWRYADLYIGCSKNAGFWIFPKKIVNSDEFKIIYNAIDFKKYSFDLSKREKMRQKLGINNEILLGTVGGINFAKNQKFLIDILYELSKNNDNYKLIIVGDGSLKDSLINYAESKNVINKVLFTGVVPNVPDYLQAMDVYLMPSKFEGFGIAALESQINGLYTIVSDKFPEEIVVSKNIDRLTIKNISPWINKIIHVSHNILNHKNELLPKASDFDSANSYKQYKIIIGDDYDK